MADQDKFINLGNTKGNPSYFKIDNDFDDEKFAALKPASNIVTVVEYHFIDIARW